MKVRDLSIAKAYRDTIKKWGEPNIIRKRTIIAPPMSEAPARDVNIKATMKAFNKDQHEESTLRLASEAHVLFKQIMLEEDDLSGKNLAKFRQDYIEYKLWYDEERKLRNDLNNIGLSTNLLQNKINRTALEERVLKRLLPPTVDNDGDNDASLEIEPHVIPTPPPLSKAQMKLLPLLQQPLPVALSIIAEYCHRNKLRLLDLYKQMDKDKDWQISREEVRKIVRGNKIPLTSAQLEDMIIALDVDNNDQLDYRELAQGVEAYRIDERWQKIRELMQIMEAHQVKTEKILKEREKSVLTRKSLSGRKIGSARRGILKSAKKDNSSDDDSDSSLHRLQLPNVETNEESDSLASKARERRMRKHRDRKERAKQRNKQIKTKGFLPSTIKGVTGQIKDRYAETTVNHVKTSLDMMHTSGIPIKEDTVKRVMLFPFDKPTKDCKTSLRQPGVNPASRSDFGYGPSILQHENRRKPGDATEGQAIDSDHGRKKQRKSRRGRKAQRDSSPFWIDSNHSLLVEEFERRTPQESLFRVVKTPDFKL